MHTRREGAFVKIDGQRYRLAEPLFSLTEAIEALAGPDSADSDTRMAHVAKLQSMFQRKPKRSF
jgi:hypothetical protein